MTVESQNASSEPRTVKIGPEGWRHALRIYIALLINDGNGVSYRPPADVAVKMATAELRACAAIADACGPLLFILERLLEAADDDVGATIAQTVTAADIASVRIARTILTDEMAVRDQAMAEVRAAAPCGCLACQERARSLEATNAQGGDLISSIPGYAEATSFGHAVTLWQQHLTDLYGEPCSDEPESVALIHDDEVIRPIPIPRRQNQDPLTTDDVVRRRQIDAWLLVAEGLDDGIRGYITAEADRSNAPPIHIVTRLTAIAAKAAVGARDAAAAQGGGD